MDKKRHPPISYGKRKMSVCGVSRGIVVNCNKKNTKDSRQKANSPNYPSIPIITHNSHNSPNYPPYQLTTIPHNSPNSPNSQLTNKELIINKELKNYYKSRSTRDQLRYVGFVYLNDNKPEFTIKDVSDFLGIPYERLVRHISRDVNEVYLKFSKKIDGRTRFIQLTEQGIKLTKSEIEEYYKLKKIKKEDLEIMFEVEDNMDVSTQIKKFNEFIESNYYKELLDNNRKGNRFIVIDFAELSKFDPYLADLLLEQPEEIIKVAEIAIDNLEDIKGIKVRFNNLPKTQTILIREIRSKHIGKLLSIEGIVRQKSDVRPQVTTGKFECPSCLPKGTPIQTPKGLEKIENVKEVLSINSNFKLTNKQARVIRTGKKKQVIINNELYCSEEHPWFVYRNGTTEVIQTKDLNIGDIFYQLYDQDLYNMQETPQSIEADLFGEMQEETLQCIPNGGRENKSKQPTDFRTLPKGKIYSSDSQNNWKRPQTNKEETNQTRNKNKDNERTNENKRETFNYIQAWEAMWFERISKDSKEKIPVDMYGLRSDKEQEKELGSTPQEWKPFRQQGGKSYDSLSAVPYKVTSLKRSIQKKEMYDLIVPETNNFILSNGVITHNCGNLINILQLDTTFKEPTRCLPKGTLVYTSSGLKPIEKADKVLCLDYNGDLIESKAKIINSGNQKIVRINGEIDCTEDHLWFVLRKGRCRFLPTKDLNISDALLQIYDKKLHNLFKRVRTKIKDNEKNRQRRTQNNLFGEEDMFSRMQEKTFFNLSERNGTDCGEQNKDNQYVSGTKDVDKGHSRKNATKQKSSISKNKKCGNNTKNIKGTDKYRYQFGKGGKTKRPKEPELQAWRKMWRGILQGRSEENRSQSLSFLYENKNPNSTPQRLKPSKSQHTKFSYVVQFMPYEITRIDKIHKEVEMFDLQVDDYNNFILSNGVVSHNCGCGRKGKFMLLNKELIDAQGLILEESPEILETSDQPKRMNVFLKDDLVSPFSEKKTAVGSKVLIIGIVKEVPVILRTGSKSVKFDLMIEANCIDTTQKDFDLTITLDEEEEIKSLSKEANIFKKLTKSIVPSIYGHKKIKEALVLQLMGGVRKIKKDGTAIRGDIHILMVGDPAAGKSQTIKRISKVAPKSRLASGTGMSGVGATASVVKSDFLGGWALEAGAMVLANNGIMCYEEIDKSNEEELNHLHTAMEQQEVYINKAGINAILSTKASILASANPKLGRFDQYGIIADQINLKPTLINRFDLIFVIQDLPNEKKDEQLADFILDLHEGKEKEDLSLIPTNLLKKFFAYARKNCFPIITKEARSEIKKFYVGLRKTVNTEQQTIKTIPLNPRQLEALVRLSEASAKTRLSNKVTKEDAKMAIDLLEHCLISIGFDKETGKIDIDRIATGISASQRSSTIIIKEIINKLEEKTGKTIPIEDIVSEGLARGIIEEKTEEIIEKLKQIGELFEPKRGRIQKIK